MPSPFETFKDEGNAFFKNKDYEKAIQSYNKCIEIESWNPVGYSNKTMALIKFGSYEDAIKVCNEGISKLNPKESKHIALKKKLDYRLEMAMNLLKNEQDQIETKNTTTRVANNTSKLETYIDLNIVPVDSLPTEFLNL